MSEAAAVVARAEGILRPLLVEAALASWAVNVEATEEHAQRRVATDVALSDVLADPDLFAAVERARGSTGEPSVERQLELLWSSMLTRQVPDELRHRIIGLASRVESRFARHRGVVGGRSVSDNEILAILRAADDEALMKEAWHASKTIGGEVADDVRELARLRNEAARALGERDWFALSLAADEMSEERLLATLADVEAATDAPFRAWKASTDARLAQRFGCAPDDLRPWHYADPFFQEVPPSGGVDLDPLLAGRDVVELAHRTFAGIGLELEPVLARSDLFPRAGKCQHAFCIDIDRGGDVRVLANVQHDAKWADTMLHELGHAAYDLGFDPGLPFLLRGTHLTLTEGIAILMGGLVGEPAWLVGVAGIEPSEVAGIEESLRAARVAERLLFARWVLVMTTFERGLYADPDGDHDARWWDLVERYQGLRRPDVPPVDAWAAKIHLGCAPVYYHTYLYGHLVAAQLRALLTREVGGLVGRPAAGALLQERLFRHGEALRWDRLLEQATGSPLSVEHFAAELAG